MSNAQTPKAAVPKRAHLTKSLLLFMQVAMYTLNGTYLGLHDVRNGRLQLCTDTQKKLNAAWTFGTSYAQTVKYRTFYTSCQCQRVLSQPLPPHGYWLRDNLYIFHTLTPQFKRPEINWEDLSMEVMMLLSFWGRFSVRRKKCFNPWTVFKLGVSL